MDNATNAVDRLNAYFREVQASGLDMSNGTRPGYQAWDKIRALPGYDEDATNALDPQMRPGAQRGGADESFRFALDSGEVIRWDPKQSQWLVGLVRK